jgi:hypothetical protein
MRMSIQLCSRRTPRARFVLDLHPPAAGPEVEISLEAPVLGEAGVLEPLRDAAVTVLAHRQRTWSR